MTTNKRTPNMIDDVCNAGRNSTSEIQHNHQANNMVNDKISKNPLAYPGDSLVIESDIRWMDEIHEMSVSGETVIAAMGIEKPNPRWEDILIMGNQLDPMPLDADESINTETIIGKNAKKPMVLKNPIYITHMSFGALSPEAKLALARGSALAETAMCSGEGGPLPDEMDSAYKYILEYVPRKYGATDENIKHADAIEIKIGQGTKPGMGGLLPAKKVTKEIAKARGVEEGKSVIAPSKFSEINNKEDLKAKVDMLREKSEGRPIGIKIAAGHIEDDLAMCVYAEPDFVTIDGRGGATAASPLLLRDSTSVPTIYALDRARKYLDEEGSDIELVITGGLRVSSDFAKAIAMGADAIAIGTAALISIGCMQYRTCHTGKCLVGVATQDPESRAKFDIEKSSMRIANFLNVSLNELEVYARICGKKNLHDLSMENLCTVNSEISDNTYIAHA